MKRILVVGITGAGKTTMAQALAARLQLSFHEMDALKFTGPQWASNPGLQQQVASIAAPRGGSSTPSATRKSAICCGRMPTR
ncbi:AAA family ATPase [Streptomyces kaempferi]|uniref:AAA family ATPase n=1 Tax=Streptomyces kaempferi TaxID=333725 RepID=A0ABW3XLW7_9ACTN